MSSPAAASDDARLEFAARVERVRNRDRGSILMVGPSEQIVLPSKQQVQQGKSREIARNATYPAALAGAFLLGFIAVIFSRYATFHLASAYTETPGSAAELAISAAVALCAVFVLSQMFRLGNKQYQALQAAGVFVMSCVFHNLIHWFPEPAATAFSPAYVAAVTSTSPANSFRLGSRYFVLDLPAPAVEGGAVAEPAEAAAPAAPEVTRVELQHSKGTTKVTHKTVKSAP